MINVVVVRKFVVKKCCPLGDYIENSQPDYLRERSILV